MKTAHKIYQFIRDYSEHHGTEYAMFNGDNPAGATAKAWLIYRRSSVQV